MAEAGILDEDDRVELLEGWIVEKMTKNPRHEAVIDATNEAICARVSRDWRVRIQSAITLLDSEPEPDLAIVPGPLARYVRRQPHAEDVALLVEVSESSLAQDRGIKFRVYARWAIQMYWIVNLIEDVVEVHWDPTGPIESPAHRGRRVFRIGEALPLSVGGQQLEPVPVREILVK